MSSIYYSDGASYRCTIIQNKTRNQKQKLRISIDGIIPTTKMSCQQIIIDLGLAKHSYQRKTSKLPTSIDVLNQLLLDKMINDEDVRNSYNKLCSNNILNKPTHSNSIIKS